MRFHGSYLAVLAGLTFYGGFRLPAFDGLYIPSPRARGEGRVRGDGRMARRLRVCILAF